MELIYSTAIRLLGLSYTLAALFNKKARLFTDGRRNLIPRVERLLAPNARKRIWFHCASLGEFEQARPVVEAVRREFPAAVIVVTFFSPSGYEIRKNFPGADFIFYLPLDTRANARRFVKAINPSLAVFVKYEFWHFYAKTLRNMNIPLISVSSIFREDQLFFKPYGSFYVKILRSFTHFFVQNDTSVRLLRSLGMENVTRAGDTRFDRVLEIVSNGEEIPVARTFKADEKVLVAGSCWPEDMNVLVPLINEGHMKFIIAPHEISEDFLREIEGSLQVRSIRFSRAHDGDPENCQVLLIDNIGMLSRLYRYGEFAFIGGAFGKGLHNVLEAACYGIPVFFGDKNYEKFQEAVDLINRGGAFPVSDYPDLKEKYEMLNAPETFLLACEVTRQYVEENRGATEKIMQYCRKMLNV